MTIKLNDRNKSTMALYRLFLVSYMLMSVKIPGMGTPHDYPKMMLTNMLVMAYWADKGLPAWLLMDDNMNVFNEEMGETYYSILSRCVLGDNIKSDFDHMNKVFTLLPLYKNVKDDISTEIRDKQFTLTWHHDIAFDADEITATSFFFKRLIKQVVDGKYRSYTWETKYPTIGKCIETMTTSYVPLVFLHDIPTKLDVLITKIRRAVSSNFMEHHVQDWPFIDDPGEVSGDDDEKAVEDVHDMDEEDENDDLVDDDVYVPDRDGVVWGPPWSDCVQGRFAVLRCEIGEVPNYGICVVKVTRKDAEVLSGQYPVRTLEGKEYLCTRSNIDVGCVRLGKWNWHSTRSTTDDYDNSSVIKYFDRLNDGALPIDVMKAVELSHAKKPIFR